MGLDVRLPIGLMFIIIGALLAGYGLITSNDSELYARSLSINVNLWWGAAMLLFGVVMFLLGRRGAAAQGVHLAEDSPEGRATEAREHQLGLEREEKARDLH